MLVDAGADTGFIALLELGMPLAEEICAAGDWAGFSLFGS